MTLRAVAVGTLLLLITLPVSFLSAILWDEANWGLGEPSPPPFPIAVLVVAAALMMIPRFRRTGLARRELLVVYAIVLVGAPLMSRFVLFYVVPKAIFYRYMAAQNPQWETSFLPLVPPWYSPVSPTAVDGFFRGEVSVPWGEWAAPLAMWYSVMLALFGASFCLILLISKQWIVHERLSFPLAQIPLEIVQEPESGNGAGRLPRSRALWIGLAISGGMTLYNSINHFVPSLPTIPLEPTKLMEWRGVGPLAGFGALYVELSPAVIGLVYLIPTDLSFSCWFFWVVRLVSHVLAIAYGATPMPPEEWSGDVFPAPYQVGAGAVVALGIWALWIARRHLSRAARLVLTRPSDQDDDGPLYRWAMLGFAVSFAWLVAFCWLSGCRALFGVILMASIVGTYFVWAKVRAETALEPIVAAGYDWLLAPINSRALRPQEIITLVSMRWATFPVSSMIYSAPVINALQTLKIADSAGIRTRRLAAALVVTFAIVLAAGCVVMLVGIYHYGYFGTAAGLHYGWPSGQNRRDGEFINQLITAPNGPSMNTVLAMIAGAVICITLGLLRLRFWWWPLNPVGFAVAMGWGLIFHIAPFVIGWAAKTLVIRYGGLKLYRNTVPLAIGLIVGDLVSSTLWAVVLLLSHS